MEKKGARPTPGAGQRRGPEAGASERPPGRRSSCSWGSSPAPPLLCSFLHGLLPFLLRSGRRSHAAALAFPSLGLPFPRIRIRAGSAPGARQGRRASSGLSPLSLHPLCPSGHAAVLGVMCHVVSVPQTGRYPLTSGLRSPSWSCPVLPAMSLSPTVHLSSPLPVSYAPAPWAARSSRPRYLVSLLFCKGRARPSDLCCSVWCRVCE